MATIQSVKKQTINYGIFYAELEDFFSKELRDQGFAGLDVVRLSTGGYSITVHVNNFKEVLGTNGVRAAIITRLIAARWNIPENKIRFNVKKIDGRGLSALTQIESLCFRLRQGIPARRAISGVMRQIMSTPGALGVEVTVSGKLRAQRAKTQKYRSGYLLRTGEPAKDFVDVAKQSILLRPGVLGLKIKIMRETSKSGKPQPDHIVVAECKSEAALPATDKFIPPKEQPRAEPRQGMSRGPGPHRAAVRSGPAQGERRTFRRDGEHREGERRERAPRQASFGRQNAQ